MDVHQVRKKLNEMLTADNQKREELIERGVLFNGYHPEMEEIHVMNTKGLDQIINVFGFPTISRVGEEAATAAWIIVMHSISSPTFMKRTLALLKTTRYQEEVDPKELAYLEDRVRVFEKRPQIYGTQFDWDENNAMSPYPIENPERVNELRGKIGLLPIEKQTEIMRERSRKEGNHPSTTYLERAKKSEDWAKKVGWIIG